MSRPHPRSINPPRPLFYLTTMKITTEPVKRCSLPLHTKGLIVIEAYSLPRNIRATARKYNIQTNQIRDWKHQGIDNDFNNFLESIVPVHEQTDAVRANLMDPSDENEEESLIRQAFRRQIDLKKRKRFSSFHHKQGGGRKRIFSEQTVSNLQSFFLEMREDDIPISVDELVCHAMLIDPVACVGASHSALQHRMYRLLEDWGSSYRRGTHKAQDTRLCFERMAEFHKYIHLMSEMMEIPPEAIYNFDETNVYFSPAVKNTYTIKGMKTIGISDTASSQQCTAMLGGSICFRCIQRCEHKKWEN